MRCTICGEIISSAQEQIATRQGVGLHRQCAERNAAQAWQQRRMCAMIQGVVSAGVVVFAVVMTGSLNLGVVLGTSLLIVHIANNRRWWYYVRRDAVIWLKQANLWLRHED
jgi:hypothetical protein